MNGGEPKIEIFKPFGEAFELTKKILFQPFDLGKWCVIGFAAFLANLSGGWSFNYNPSWNRDARWHHWPGTDDLPAALHQIPIWVIVLIAIAVVLLVIGIVMTLAWLSARGRFIFTDCIVRNRGAIAAPWREFRKEGNSLFLFSLLIGLVFLAVAMFLFVPIFLPSLVHWKPSQTRLVVTVSGLVFIILIIFLLGLAWALILQFMVPVMYRHRCRAREAFAAVISLIATYPGEVVLYCLFLFVLALATAIVSCAATCLTCCVAAIPYVGTVILLPIFVLLRSFSLLFLRQFGPDYDLWAEISQIEPPSVSPPAPPIPPAVPPLPS
jgi:MFS family permease